MPSSSDQNLNPRGIASSSSNEYSSNVLPPPPEVKVRTMASDLEFIAKSGGSTPQFQNVKAPGLASLTSGVSIEEPTEPTNKVLIAAVIITAVALALAIAYFVYRIFFNQAPQLAEKHASSATVTIPSSTHPPSLGSSGSFIHKSLFRNPADTLLPLTVNSSAQNSANLKTYTQQIKDVIRSDKTSVFFEINAKGVDGHDLSIHEVLSAAGAPVLDPGFISLHFDPDPTVFIYQNKSGIWPGYILALKPGENRLFLRDEISQIEKSQKISSLFINTTGSPGNFQDTIISGQPARALRFNSGEVFVYGWFRGYLILSTSEDGLKETLGRL